MNAKISHPVERDAQWVQAYQHELVERITQAVQEDGTIEPLQSVRLHRCSCPNEPLHGVAEPHFAVIVQGSKEIYLGNERYLYDPYHYCLGTVGLPVASRIIEASPEKPYLSFRLELDPLLVGSVMTESGYSAPPGHSDAKALTVSPLDAHILDAVVRLVRLVENPAEAQFLAPLVKREIMYRLLMGKQGDRLRHIAVLSSYSPSIARAIERIQKDFDQPLRIDDIASELGMSASGFHHHFKSVTALSPLQFQKRLRLQAARRLMFGQGFDAARAAYRVGYHNAAHFNREYKSLFGLPPMRDIERLRGIAGEDIGLVAD